MNREAPPSQPTSPPPPSTLGTRPSSVAVKGRRLCCRAALRPKDVGLLELW